MLLSLFKQNKLLLVLTLLVSLLFSVLRITAAFVLQNILDAVTGQDEALFRTMLWVVPLYVLAVGAVKLLDSMLSARLVMRTVKNLRQNLFDGILRRDNETFQSVNTADYLSALTNDVKIIEEHAIVPLLQVFQYACVFLLAVAALFYLSPLVAGMMFLCLIVMVLLPGALSRPIGKRQAILSETLARFTIGLKDKFSGYDVIRAYRLTGQARAEFAGQNADAAQSKYKVDRLLAASTSLSQMLGMAVQFLIMLFAGYLVLRGEITAGVLLAFIELSGSFVQPVMMIMQNIPVIQGTGTIVARIQALTETPPSAFQGTAKPDFSNALQFTHVAFAYKAEQPVFTDLQLTLQKNRKYAIVGASGCGKTTLLRLLCAGYSGYTGEITVDGKELHTLDIDGLLAMTAVIHQHIYLFDESIRDNIALHQTYTEAQWKRALSVSGVDRFLGQMENGLDTRVGENGTSLSGGQRQRIAVARALIAQKPILLLDEGTSAIDQQTAYEIESALLTIPDSTIITITHNLNPSLLRQYDAIVFIEQGVAAQCGAFDDLMQDARFRAFVAIQENTPMEPQAAIT